VAVVQLEAQLPDEPEHAYGAQDGVPSLPAVTLVHRPMFPGRLHALQGPAQAVLQHTPSTQLLDTHWLPAEQAWPSSSLHAPDPSHELVPVQLFGSLALVIVVQLPTEEPSQRWQVPQLEELQQTPSTQLAVLQSLPVAQLEP
jgi:hypothetical protein